MILSTLSSFFSALPLLGAAAPASAAPNPLVQFAPMLFIIVIFYFLLIRPQQKQRKEHQNLITSLNTGDKIVTVSGIHGMIANVKEQTFVVKVADNVKIEFDKSAISSRLTEKREKPEKPSDTQEA